MSDMRLTVFIAVLLTATIGFATDWYNSPSPESAAAAAAFLNEIMQQSPRHDGAPLRIYEIRDVDLDGAFEVLEHRSAFEDAPGFLSAPLGPAFDWVTIYRQRNGRFQEATAEFRWFLTLQRLKYEQWIRAFEASESLTGDASQLVAANREKFIRILKDYVARVEKLLRREG